jgi:hypothetical protein
MAQQSGYPGVCLEGLRKTGPRQDCWFVGQDSNRELLKNKSKALPLL